MASSRKAGASRFLPPALVRGAAFLAGPGRAPAAMLLLVAGFSLAACLVWLHVYPRVIGSYTVGPEQVRITPLPEWIHIDARDFRRDLFRNVTLDGPLSLLDDNLVQRIAIAFSLHPWVAKVTRVRKFYGGVEVELVYRRPVCTVQLPAGDLLPVDAEGVLLPNGDFSPLEKQGYPCLAGIDRGPMGPPGQRWGDARVVDGAEIAAALGPAWQLLKLFRIQPCPRPAGAEPAYELFTRAGTPILWGPPPGSKAPDDLPPAEKVGRLLRYAAEHGGLDAHDGPRQLDIRTLPPSKPGGY